MNDLFWKDKRVLVTGAGGFIGSHLTEALLARGARVRAIVKYNSRNSWGYLDDLTDDRRQRCEVVLGDITDPFAPLEWVEGCEYVFHLAALIAVPFSYKSPASYEAVNVRGTLHLLEACRRVGIRRLIHTSTSEVYGTAVRIPIAEDHPLQGQSPYAASKIAADKFAESFGRSYDLPVTVARPFNTFGPRQSARAIIPTIIAQALVGDTVAIGAQEPIRDFLFVEDTARGLLALAACDAAVGRVVNLGTGVGISIGDLAREIVALIGGDKKIETDVRRFRPRESEVLQLIGDASLAKRLAGWQPEVSLDEGLVRTIEWIRGHVAEYRTGMYVL